LTSICTALGGSTSDSYITFDVFGDLPALKLDTVRVLAFVDLMAIWWKLADLPA
jgi:hypothetical protein